MGLKQVLTAGAEWLDRKVAQGWAEMAAYSRQGLKDFQSLILGEWGGPNPSEPGTFPTSPAPREIYEQRHPEASREHFDKRLEAAAQQPQEPGQQMER